MRQIFLRGGAEELRLYDNRRIAGDHQGSAADNPVCEVGCAMRTTHRCCTDFGAHGAPYDA